MEDAPLSAESVFRSEYVDMYWTARSGFRFPLAPRSAAVDGVVAGVLALDDIDDVFGDVGGVVVDALEVLGDEDQFERGKDDAGSTADSIAEASQPLPEYPLVY